MKRAGVFLTILLIVVGCSGCRKPGPEQVVQEFFRSIEKGKVNDAFDMCISGYTRDAEKSGALRTLLDGAAKAMSENGGIKDLASGGVEVNGDRAKVTVNITWGSNAKPEVETVQLVQEEGRWKIDPTDFF